MKNNKLYISSREAIKKRNKNRELYNRKNIKGDLPDLFEEHVNIKLRRLFEDPGNTNHGETLLQAINWCCSHDIKLPGWVREEFLICYEQYFFLSGDADTKTPLVSAFRTDPKIGNHRGQKRQKNQIRHLVWQEINKLKKKGVPTDERLFSIAGDAYGISGSTARDMYYEIVNITKK